MRVTNEGYILARNLVSINSNKNSFIKFIKKYKVSIFISVVFISLMLVEILLLNSFVRLLITVQ